jgi:hypothetical protein
MNATTTAITVAVVNFLSEVIRVRMNKPEGWKPSPQEIADFVVEIDAATPEAEKEAARKRLGL